MRPTLLTPKQEFELSFYLQFSFVPKQKIVVCLNLHSDLGNKNLKKTLMPGHPHPFHLRMTNFVCRVPEDILGRKTKKILTHLAKYEIFIGSKKIYTEELSPVCIIDNHTYFEKETVPEILEGLGFCVTVIGGKDNPDLVAYHVSLNPQRINVEPTLSATYGLSDLDNDRGKFGRYSQRFNFKRMLTVCQCERISRDVVDELNKTSDPIGLIEFKDLYSIRQKTMTKSDQAKAYALLTSSGKVTTPYPPNGTVLFRPIKFRIDREI